MEGQGSHEEERPAQADVPAETDNPGSIELTPKAQALSESSVRGEKHLINRTPRIFSVHARDTRPSVPGNLRALALEILVMIFQLLDMQTLTNLRATNFALSQLVDEITPYQSLLEHVPAVMQAIADTKALAYYPIRQINFMIRRVHCIFCEAIGIVFFIPLAVRCCMRCLQGIEATILITVPRAKALFGIKNTYIDQVPTMRTFTGYYGRPPLRYAASHWVTTLDNAIIAAIKQYGSEELVAQAADDIFQPKMEAFQRRLDQFNEAQDSENPPTQRPEPPIHWRISVMISSPSCGSLCAVRLPPFYTYRGQTIPASYHVCLGCRREESRYRAIRNPPADYDERLRAYQAQERRVYLTAEMNQHVEECEGAEKIIAKKGWVF